MSGYRAALMFMLGLGMAGATSIPAMAQEAGGGGDIDARFDRAAIQRRNEERLKELLGVTEDEWKALQPKIEKLREAQKASRIDPIGRVGGGVHPLSADSGPDSPVTAAARQLQETLNSKDATPEQIKAKLEALQDAKAKADAEVVAAQAEVKALLNVRQEAVMVSYGLFD